jgi:hypothetical protein
LRAASSPATAAAAIAAAVLLALLLKQSISSNLLPLGGTGGVPSCAAANRLSFSGPASSSNPGLCTPPPAVPPCPLPPKPQVWDQRRPEPPLKGLGAATEPCMTAGVTKPHPGWLKSHMPICAYGMWGTASPGPPASPAAAAAAAASAARLAPPQLLLLLSGAVASAPLQPLMN